MSKKKIVLIAFISFFALAPILLPSLVGLLCRGGGGSFRCLSHFLLGFFGLIFLVPIGIGIHAFKNSTENKKKAFLKTFGIAFVSLVLGLGIYAYVGRQIRQIVADRDFEKMQNLGYPIRIIDPITNATLNKTIITIESPLTVNANVLSNAIPPNGIITATLKVNGNTFTEKLLATGRVTNDRHYYQGTLIFDSPSGATGELTISSGIPYTAVGYAPVVIK